MQEPVLLDMNNIFSIFSICYFSPFVIFKIVVSGMEVLCLTQISWYMKGFPNFYPCVRVLYAWNL